MVDFTLRPATEADSSSIKDLIHRVGINPMDLDWRRFVLAVDGSGKMLGCGQLKPHGKDVIELASIAVEPSHQHQGIARVIIEYLVARRAASALFNLSFTARIVLRKVGLSRYRVCGNARLFSPIIAIGQCDGRVYER